MGQLTRISQQEPGSITNWQEPSLPTKLADAVNSSTSVMELPIPGPSLLPALRAVVAAQPPMPGPTDINGMVLKLCTVLASKKMTASEASIMQQAYQEGLADIPLPDLHAACAQLVKTATFMPKVAEIREVAMQTMNRRLARQARCRMLILRHERDWTPPVEEICGADVGRLRKEIGERLAAGGNQR